MNSMVYRKLFGYLYLILIMLNTVACLDAGNTYRLNQMRAIRSLNEVKNLQASFKSQNGRYGNIQEICKGSNLTSLLLDGSKEGYKFTIEAKNDSFIALATPIKFKETGSLSFYMDETGVIHGAVKDGKDAALTDAIINIRDQ